MPLRPAQTFNLAVASIALALIAEGAILWKVGQNQANQAPVLPSGVAKAPTPPPYFVVPGGEAPVQPPGGLPGSGAPAPGVPGPGAPGAGLPPTGGAAPDGAGLPADRRALAKSYFDAATAALAKKDNATALANFLKVVEITPDHLPTRLNLAMLYLEAKKPAEAIPQLEKAAQLDPKGAGARFELARALLSLKKTEEAIAPLREVLKLTPQEREPRELLAQIYLAQKKPQAAYDLWAKQAESNPKDVDAHLQAAGLAAEALKKPAEAEKWLRKALAGEPRDPRPALLMGRYLLAQNKNKEAASILGKAAKAAPNAFDVFPMLANARLANGDLSGAQGAIQRALDIMPKATNAAGKAQVAQIEAGLRFTLGRVLGQAKKPKAAVAEFKKAADLTPKDPEVRSLLALAAAQSGDQKSAVTALQAALAIDPKRAEDHRLLAQIYARQKNWDAANGQYEDYLSLQPRDGGALAEWAQVAAQSNKPEQSLRIWRMLAALQPKNPLPYVEMGIALRDQKKPKDALENFEQALQRSPNDANALLEIGRLQMSLKQQGDATATWQKLITLEPNYAPAYLSLLESSGASGDASSARTFLARQLAKQENPKVLGEVLKYYGKGKRDAEAKALLADILKRNPKDKAAGAALDSYEAAASVVPTAEGTPVGTEKGP